MSGDWPRALSTLSAWPASSPQPSRSAPPTKGRQPSSPWRADVAPPRRAPPLLLRLLTSPLADGGASQSSAELDRPWRWDGALTPVAPRTPGPTSCSTGGTAAPWRAADGLALRAWRCSALTLECCSSPGGEWTLPCVAGGSTGEESAARACSCSANCMPGPCCTPALVTAVAPVAVVSVATAPPAERCCSPSTPLAAPADAAARASMACSSSTSARSRVDCVRSRGMRSTSQIRMPRA